MTPVSFPLAIGCIASVVCAVNIMYMIYKSWKRKQQRGNVMDEVFGIFEDTIPVAVIAFSGWAALLMFTVSVVNWLQLRSMT